LSLIGVERPPWPGTRTYNRRSYAKDGGESDDRANRWRRPGQGQRKIKTYPDTFEKAFYRKETGRGLSENCFPYFDSLNNFLAERTS
jgi:hypothetical protein